MLLGWFDARQASEVGITLADEFAVATIGQGKRGRGKRPQNGHGSSLQAFLLRAQRQAKVLELNFYKKAKLANSFKWRLLEKGIDSAVATEVTQTLVMHLSMQRLTSVTETDSDRRTSTPTDARKADELLTHAGQQLAQRAFAEAIASYQAFIKLNPKHALALNNLGVALCQLGRFAEAEPHFREAAAVKPKFADAHANLGALLRQRGQLLAAENSLRRALKLSPSHVDAQVNLGLTILSQGRSADAKPHLERALKSAPRNVAALLGMSQIASIEGRFDHAEAQLNQVLEINPRDTAAWSGLASLRKMTKSDAAWLTRAEELIATKILPAEEANLRFAIGKYCDDVGDYTKAFENFRRGNEILKSTARIYNRDARRLFVDDLIKVYTPQSVAQLPSTPVGPSASTKPVLVVGMPRSGTSLVEQIIASHPKAAGAGELLFWAGAMHRHEETARQQVLDERTRKELAAGYLGVLATYSPDAARVVDKTPVNAEYLGIIHSVFPHARIIYTRRHPIDTCLSIYFQQFASTMEFTMDLGDLAHYYREHHRLMSHWTSVLPPGTILDVSYEDLVADQETWTRKILEFIGLEWDENCLNFQATKRQVATASAWQVRQKIYRHSVERWRNYEKYIAPLRGLQELIP